jgi:pimeloyl-ACP methyl ester carboxylesterase
VVSPFADAPDRRVVSADGTPIAVFSVGPADGAALPPLVLVHGTTADHRTWRAVGPELATRWRLIAIDRRGRGDSGDAPGYSIEHEFDDLAAVADMVARDSGMPVDVVGHSLGGRIALGASLRSDAIRRIVAYESAPSPPGEPATDPGLLGRLRGDLAAGDLEGLLARFMTEAVGMPPNDLAAFRADPVWPLRVAAAPTIPRELDAAEHAPGASLRALAPVSVPVLQLVGSLSPTAFRTGAAALDARLAHGRLEIIDGARHGAHHSHVAEFVARVEAFLAL